MYLLHEIAKSLFRSAPIRFTCPDLPVSQPQELKTFRRDRTRRTRAATGSVGHAVFGVVPARRDVLLVFLYLTQRSGQIYPSKQDHADLLRFRPRHHCSRLALIPWSASTRRRTLRLPDCSIGSQGAIGEQSILLTSLPSEDSLAPWLQSCGELRTSELRAVPPGRRLVKSLCLILPKVACVMFSPDRVVPSRAVAREIKRPQAFSESAFCFSIELIPEPGALARVFEQFAKRGLLPTRWHSDVVEADLMQVDIQMADLPADVGKSIARCLGGIVGVNHVLTASKMRSVSGSDGAGPMAPSHQVRA